jgi:DNA-binding NarL/FixJ family response regulator
MAEGKSNQDIADGLVLSLNTVKKHVSAIMGKLNAKNRSLAVVIARSQGLIR